MEILFRAHVSIMIDEKTQKDEITTAVIIDQWWWLFQSEVAVGRDHQGSEAGTHQ